MKLESLFEDWKHNAIAAIGLAIGGDAYSQNTKQNSQIEQQELSIENLSKFITKWEGFSSKMYVDTTGNKTVGYGFNLERRDASTILANHSLDLNKIIDLSQEISKEVAFKILTKDVESSIKVAKNFVSNFNSLPNQVKEILVDLVYNLGSTKIQEFKKFKAAIENKNFKSAADELENSKWAKQTKRRADNHIKTLRELK